MQLFNNSFRIDYKNRIYINILSTATILIAVVYFGIFRPMSSMKYLKTTVQMEKVSLEKSYITGKNLRQLSESLKVVEPQLSKLDEIFIKKEGALDFITSIEEVAENAEVQQRISLATKGSSKSKSVNETIPIQLSSSGGFSQEMTYLARLEALRYYINVKTLEISNTSFRSSSWTFDDGVKGGDSQNEVGLQILADTYWQNQ